MYLWLITGELEGISCIVVVPCLTRKRSLSEVEARIKESPEYADMAIRKIEAFGWLDGQPGCGLWRSAGEEGKAHVSAR